MIVNKKDFEYIMRMLRSNTPKQLAEKTTYSERVIQRIREAGTWDRWPYIVAKTTHGYMTPEYKLYLKRRGLPITPARREVTTTTTTRKQTVTVTVTKKSWLQRLLGR